MKRDAAEPTGFHNNLDGRTTTWTAGACTAHSGARSAQGTFEAEQCWGDDVLAKFIRIHMNSPQSGSNHKVLGISKDQKRLVNKLLNIDLK